MFLNKPQHIHNIKPLKDFVIRKGSLCFYLTIDDLIKPSQFNNTKIYQNIIPFKINSN